MRGCQRHRAYHAVVSFFELPRPTATVFRAVAVSPPAWLGPPHNVLPGVAPVELVIARTEETVVAIGGIDAYPEGFGFTLSLRLRTLSAREEQFPYLIDRAADEVDPLPDEFLRFGVQFADGRNATNLDRPDYDPEGPAPGRPVLIQQGGVAAAQPGIWSTGCGHRHRPGRLPSSASGRAEASWSHGSRSTLA
jgi:hypothetical protein